VADHSATRGATPPRRLLDKSAAGRGAQDSVPLCEQARCPSHFAPSPHRAEPLTPARPRRLFTSSNPPVLPSQKKGRAVAMCGRSVHSELELRAHQGPASQRTDHAPRLERFCRAAPGCRVARSSGFSPCNCCGDRHALRHDLQRKNPGQLMDAVRSKCYSTDPCVPRATSKEPTGLSADSMKAANSWLLSINITSGLQWPIRLVYHPQREVLILGKSQAAAFR